MGVRRQVSPSAARGVDLAVDLRVQRCCRRFDRLANNRRLAPIHKNIEHRAYGTREGYILFLLDEQAQPETIGFQIIPFPIRLHPATETS
jgi:hypothetical protein